MRKNKGQTWWDWLKEADAIRSVLQFSLKYLLPTKATAWGSIVIASLATFLVSLGSHFRRLEHVEQGALLILVFALVLVAYRVLAEIVTHGTRVKVLLTPSEGPSPSMFLKVTNQGKKRDFYAKCELIRSHNSPNDVTRKTFQLKWDMTSKQSISIDHKDSRNLLIAKFQTDVFAGHGEFTICELTQGVSRDFYWLSWNANPEEVLPEIELQVIVFSEGIKPQSTKFKLKPARYTGPLEMERI